MKAIEGEVFILQNSYCENFIHLKAVATFTKDEVLLMVSHVGTIRVLLPNHQIDN